VTDTRSPLPSAEGERALGVHRPRLARGTVLNLLGMGAPLVAGLLAIPVLVRALGTDRFGVLTIAWMITGYFSLFDLGLGRALTQVIAARVSETGERHAPPVVWPAIGMMLALGVAGGAALAAVAPWLVTDVLRIPAALQDETRLALYVLAAGIPFVVMTAALNGILAAFHEFGLLNAIRAPMGIMILVAPVLVLPWSVSLVAVALALVAVRVGAFVALVAACRRFMPPRGAAPSTSPAGGPGIRALFGFGAWMTVSNIISPLMVHLDRFVIGSMVSMSAVAYYATPYEVVTKAWIVPGALVGVLFPAFSVSAGRDRERMERLFTRGSKYMALLLFLPMLLVIAFAREGLELWLGAEFAANGATVMQWLAAGVFINCIAQVFFTLVQGAGRPDLTARLHLMELPIYLVVLWWCIGEWGIVGAAVAWSARVALDAVLLFVVSGRLLQLRGAVVRRLALGLAVATGALAVPLALQDPRARAGAVIAVTAVFALAAWRFALAADERERLRQLTLGR